MSSDDSDALFQPDMSLIDKSQFVGLSKNDARKRIQDRIEEAIKALRTLGASQNELAPFHVLADELLTDIFLYVRAVESETSYTHRTSRRWMRLSWVCRRWRNVALRSQLLWSKVEASNIELAEMFLQRSGTAPASFQLSPMFGPIESERTRRYIDMIAQHANHIAELDIAMHDPDVMKVFIDEIGSFSYSRLLKLSLLLPDKQIIANPLPEVRFYRSGLDVYLREFKLHRISFPWTPFSGTQLRRLILQNPDNHTCSCPSASEFVDVLEGCPQLEAIRLHWQGPTLSPHLDMYPEPSRTVKLDRLRNIGIFNEPLVIAYILAHLDFPSSTKIELFCEIDFQSSGVDKILPRGNKLEVLSVLESITFEMADGFGAGVNWPFFTEIISIKCDGDQQGGIDILFRPKGLLSLYDLIPMVFRSSPTLFPLSPIKSMKVLSRYTMLTTEDWRTVLSFYSRTLENLTLNHEHSDSVESAILRFLEILRAPQEEMEPVICPNLASLHLLQVTAGDDYAGALTHCFRSRFERGLKLPHLTFGEPMDWCGEKEWECPDLTAFVEDVDYME
ncbi:hypothetical protein QCA50_004781 [Cerrena zonata]|uniref:F-box domain-containing protein n=1 Tax=Cerrena zonata TaxID=2478898 RepID=A0AAW0GHU5_9APHY